MFEFSVLKWIIPVDDQWNKMDLFIILILSPTSIHQCRNEMSKHKKGAFNAIRRTYLVNFSKTTPV